MKRGFTLIELVVVLIIVAVLGVLGLTQYTGLIEKARGAEAKEILGSLRKLAAAYYMANNALPAATDLGIGAPGGDLTPNTCVGMVSHYFSYAVSGTVPDITITATRCLGSNGKTPGRSGTGPFTLSLLSELDTGVDAWGWTGGY